MDLTLEAFSTGYGRVRICRDIDLSVSSGEILTVLGANGAGKTTLLRGISGLLRAFGGSVRADGQEVTRWSPRRRLRAGIVRVPQDSSVFPEMTVTENLLMGGYLTRSRRVLSARTQAVHQRLPLLSERRDQIAGTLSGGQQRLLVIGRALMAQPRLLILDEPCTGLSPTMQAEVRGHLAALAGTGTSILVAEQNIPWAIESSNRVVVLARGAVRSEHAGRAGSAPPGTARTEDILAEIGVAARDAGAASPASPAGTAGSAGSTREPRGRHA